MPSGQKLNAITTAIDASIADSGLDNAIDEAIAALGPAGVGDIAVAVAAARADGWDDNTIDRHTIKALANRIHRDEEA